MKQKLTGLIESIFQMKGSHFLAYTDRIAFFTSHAQTRFKLWFFIKVCDALSYFLDNIFIRFGTKLHRQILGIPMSTNCVPLVTDLSLKLS